MCQITFKTVFYALLKTETLLLAKLSFKGNSYQQLHSHGLLTIITLKARKPFRKHFEFRKTNESLIKLAGVVLLPRRSGTPSSILCAHQQNRNFCNCRPRIPRAQCLCGFYRRLPRRDVGGANFLVCCQFLYACRLQHQ